MQGQSVSHHIIFYCGEQYFQTQLNGKQKYSQLRFVPGLLAKVVCSPSGPAFIKYVVCTWSMLWRHNGSVAMEQGVEHYFPKDTAEHLLQ